MNGSFKAKEGVQHHYNERGVDYLPNQMPDPPYFGDQIFDFPDATLKELRARNRELDQMVQNAGPNHSGSAVFTAYFTAYLESGNTGRAVGRVEWQVSATWEWGRIRNSI